jgi:hypothetical protein
MKTLRNRDLEVELHHEGSKAIIEGKTSVPFKTFVQLILQRKVSQILKTNSEESIILSSNLLTDLASAPDDSQENRTQLVIVTLGVGILAGIFTFSILMVGLLSFKVALNRVDFLIVAVVLVSLAGLTSTMAKMKKKNRAQKIADAMERVTSMLTK